MSDSYAIIHITDNIDICSKISKLVAKQRRFKRDYNICISDVKNIKYNMMYLENLNKCMDMILIQQYNPEKYKEICDRIKSNDIPYLKFYNINRGRSQSILHQMVRTCSNLSNNNSIKLYFKFLMHINKMDNKLTAHSPNFPNITPNMYSKLQKHKGFNK